MGTNCIQNCQRMFTKENNDEIKTDNNNIKNLEKKVRFTEIDVNSNSHRKSSSSSSFGLFDNNDKKKKSILKKPSPKNNKNKKYITNSDTKNTSDNSLMKKNI